MDERDASERGCVALAIGDCNNDGAVNNFDIGCFVNLITSDSRCADDFVGACGSSGFRPAAPQGEGGDDGWAHFWEVIAALREQFGG